MEAGLLRAAHAAGVPVPEVVAAGRPDGLDPGWLVVERLEGEAIPRRILRNDELAAARTGLTGQTAAALAAIHSIDPGSVAGLPDADPLRDPRPFLEALDEQRPVLELGARWLALGEPTGRGPTVVHGDFRMGNFLVDAHGLRGVLDWELAHRGNPVEDIGWLCARAWRFGGPGRVGGFGELDAFLAAYHAAGGRAVRRRRGAVVGGVRIGQVGGDLHAAGRDPPAWFDPLGGTGRHRPAGLRVRVGHPGPARSGHRLGGGGCNRKRSGADEPPVRLSVGRRTGGGGAGVHRDQGDGVHRRTGPLRGSGGPQRAGHGRPRTGSRTGSRGRPSTTACAPSASEATPRW